MGVYLQVNVQYRQQHELYNYSCGFTVVLVQVEPQLFDR